MSTENKCTECGAVIPGGSPGDLCARCLLGLGLEPGQGGPDLTAPLDSPQAPSTVGPHGNIADGLLPAPDAAHTVELHDTATEIPGTCIGRYKLLEKIGEGGFGAVYVAEQKEPVKRRVALKIIKLGMDTRQVVARFEAERQALALMDHPNIAKIFDGGATASGRPYFVMELVRGIPITQYCDTKRLATAKRLELFIQVCRAIQHAHQKGIIHRDIKPSNILVTLHDGVPVPKVIDFGIAKATQAELTDKTVYTQFQHFIGTPAYMSPEQTELSGLDIDTRSDIYALGVLFYELLVGRTPFDPKELLAAGLDEMRRTIREQEPVRPSTRLRSMAGEELTTTAERRGAEAPRLISQLRGDLDWVVMKCLEKDRTQRYETCNGLAQDIERHLKHEPVLARPPSMGYRLQKSFRRNRLAFTAAGAVGLALVLGVLFSTWEAVRATKARRDEAAARGRADRAAQEARDEKDRAEKGEQKALASELAARQNLYAADMNLAYAAWQENNLGRAVQLLDRHRPAPHEPDLRGWEWRYLWGLTRSEALYTLGQHSNVFWGVYGLAISSDDRYFATSDTGGGGEVRLWDVASRRTVEVPEANDAGGSVAFSPDGKLLAFATNHRGVRLWDIAAHREVGGYPVNTTSFCNGPCLGFSPDGRQLATGGNDGKVALWDLTIQTTNGPRLEFNAHRGVFEAVLFAPDGQTLVTAGGEDNTVRTWAVPTGRPLVLLTNFAPNGTGGVALSPDGKILAVGDWDAKIRIWDLGQQREVAVRTNHTRWISSLAFSPDGKTLASASADYTIKLWETRNWQEVQTLKGSQNEVWGVVFSHDGKTLFTGSKGGKILAWDGRPRAREVQVLRRPDDAEDFLLLANGASFGIHSNRTFNFWEPKTHRELPAHPITEWEIWTNRSTMALSPGMERIALATRSGRIYLLDAEGKRQAPVVGLLSDAQVLQFSADGKLLAAASRTELEVWDVENLRAPVTLPRPDREPSCVRFAPDGQRVAVGNSGGYVEVWDLVRKQRAAEWQTHMVGFSDLAFTPDGKRLVTVHGDNKAWIWDVDGPHESVSLGQTLNAYRSVAVSPDGRRIAIGTSDGQIKIWNSATAQELVSLKRVNDWLPPDVAHAWSLSYINGLAFLPREGDILISSTYQESRLWRAPSWAEIEAAEKLSDGKDQ